MLQAVESSSSVDVPHARPQTLFAGSTTLLPLRNPLTRIPPSGSMSNALQAMGSTSEAVLEPSRAGTTTAESSTAKKTAA